MTPTDAWTEDQRKLIDADPQLSLIGTSGLDALLSAEERTALQEHLTGLALLRRRVLGDHGSDGMP